MIKLSASYSKKLPVDGVEYSSKQYSAGLEIEVADSISEKGLQQRLEVLYRVLEGTVDGKLNGNGHARTASPDSQGNGNNVQEPVPAEKPEEKPAPESSNGSATVAQQRAIFAIGNSVGLSQEQVQALVKERFNVPDPAHISRKDASSLIDLLKSRQASGAK